jgi:hypothetical protein
MTFCQQLSINQSRTTFPTFSFVLLIGISSLTKIKDTMKFTIALLTFASASAFTATSPFSRSGVAFTSTVRVPTYVDFSCWLQ